MISKEHAQMLVRELVDCALRGSGSCYETVNKTKRLLYEFVSNAELPQPTSPPKLLKFTTPPKLQDMLDFIDDMIEGALIDAGAVNPKTRAKQAAVTDALTAGVELRELILEIKGTADTGLDRRVEFVQGGYEAMQHQYDVNCRQALASISNLLSQIPVPEDTRGTVEVQQAYGVAMPQDGSAPATEEPAQRPLPGLRWGVEDAALSVRFRVGGADMLVSFPAILQAAEEVRKKLEKPADEEPFTVRTVEVVQDGVIRFTHGHTEFKVPFPTVMQAAELIQAGCIGSTKIPVVETDKPLCPDCCYTPGGDLIACCPDCSYDVANSDWGKERCVICGVIKVPGTTGWTRHRPHGTDAYESQCPVCPRN